MVAWTLARWMLLEHARRPGSWVAIALAAAAWPAALAFGWLGITTREEPLSSHAYEIAFLAALWGIGLGVTTLARGSWILERAHPARRIGAEAGALAGALVLPSAAALLPAMTLAPAASGALGLGFWVAVALTWTHLVALGLVALRLPAGPVARALAVPVAAWLIPALAPGGGPSSPSEGVGIGQEALARAGDVLRNLLDVSRHGRLGLELPAELAHRGAVVLPISALVGAACLLAARAPSVHALRNPR
jgi:hypothetical protein